VEPNQLNNVRQRLNDLRIQKGTIRDRTDSLTQELLKPTVDSKTAWDRACESGLESTYETDTKAAIREELEMLEGRERFIDEAIEGGMTVADQLHGQASVKACQPKRRRLRRADQAPTTRASRGGKSECRTPAHSYRYRARRLCDWLAAICCIRSRGAVERSFRRPAGRSLQAHRRALPGARKAGAERIGLTKSRASSNRTALERADRGLSNMDRRELSGAFPMKARCHSRVGT
jgi:hypothetical protein